MTTNLIWYKNGPGRHNDIAPNNPYFDVYFMSTFGLVKQVLKVPRKVRAPAGVLDRKNLKIMGLMGDVINRPGYNNYTKSKSKYLMDMVRQAKNYVVSYAN